MTFSLPEREDSQLPIVPRAERLMQRAETLLPASMSGLTVQSLRALSEQHPFRDRLAGRVPLLVLSLLRSYLHSLCDLTFDSGLLLNLSFCSAKALFEINRLQPSN